MIDITRNWYECEYCGKISESYDEIKECEERCLKINDKVEQLVKICNELKELGSTIELREGPYYEGIDTIDFDKRIYRLTRKKLGLCFKQEYQIVSIQHPDAGLINSGN